MEPYRMVMKRKQSSFSFAEVASGCMWPPRSYTCGFCKREFRSAQALGGHMNLHRKDRAMLSYDSLYPKYYASLSAATPCSRRGDDDLEAQGSSMVIGCKRPRLNVSLLKFSLKPCLQAAEMNNGFKASSMEDLDLELRLGHDPPQVK